ncbi:SRPBCC family protein [Spirillospora sp. NPDC047279]|uniref:SRPBCC family protein n=1 Tax=Spirillospora sp. NPDC047279 TaxID=3155478 RepID=UPI0033C1A31A
MSKNATLRTVDGVPTLRFERRLRHPVEKVWRAVSDPEEMGAWFPAAVEAELRPGAPMRFVFPEEAPVEENWDGEVLEVDPPKVFMFRWHEDVLRFELVPQNGGCLLVFTQTIGGGDIGLLGAGRTAAGWDTCLEVLAGGLEGREVPTAEDWLTPIQHYVDAFGLGDGVVREDGVRFVRDLVWKPVEDVWKVLLERDWVPEGVGGPPVAEFGGVRCEVVSDVRLGVRIEVTVAGEVPPEDLATWHVRMDLLFAAVQGSEREWPDKRVGELVRHYS